MEAEQYKVADDAQRGRISAENQLESYAFSMKSTYAYEKVEDKVLLGDHDKIVSKCKELIEWLDHNQ